MSTDRLILRLAVPSVVSNITVPLIGLADLAVSGHLGDVASIGAIAVGTTVFNVVYWLLGFLRMGSSGLTSQALGSRRLDEAARLLLRALAVGLTLALLIVLLQRPIWRVAALLVQPSAQVAPLAARYYGIVVWGAPAMLSLYALNGWYVGMQNTRAPMAVAIVQNLVNVAVSLLLALGLGWGLTGVALGTLVAQWTGLLLSLAVLLRHYRRLWLRHDWRAGLFRRAPMRAFFGVNRDIFLRTLCLIAVNLFFLSAGAREGDLVLSANALLLTFFTLFSYFMDGFAYAAEALCGRFAGAGNAAAFSRVCCRLMRWGAALAVAFTLAYLAGGRLFLGLLTDQADVVATAATYLPWAVAVPLCGFAAFIYDGIFIGVTATRGMLLASALAAAAFFALHTALQPLLANHALWLAFLVYLAARGLIQARLLARHGAGYQD